MHERPRSQRERTPVSAADELQRLLDEPTVSVPDAARLLGVGRSTVYAAIKSSEVPAIRIGHRLRIPSNWLRDKLQIHTARNGDAS